MLAFASWNKTALLRATYFQRKVYDRLSCFHHKLLQSRENFTKIMPPLYFNQQIAVAENTCRKLSCQHNITHKNWLITLQYIHYIHLWVPVKLWLQGINLQSIYLFIHVSNVVSFPVQCIVYINLCFTVISNVVLHVYCYQCCTKQIFNRTHSWTANFCHI